MGGELITLDEKRASKFGVEGGVLVNKVFDGSVLKNARVERGFIITSLTTSDGELEITSVEELNSALQNQSGTVRISGVYYDSGESYTYALALKK